VRKPQRLARHPMSAYPLAVPNDAALTRRPLRQSACGDLAHLFHRCPRRYHRRARRCACACRSMGLVDRLLSRHGATHMAEWHSGHLRSRARGFRGRMVGSTAKHHPQCLRRMAPRPRLAGRDGGQAGAEREARQRDPKHANSLRLRHHIRQLEAGGELSPPPAHLCRQAANGTYR